MSFTLSGQDIFQTGTDANLSGLAAIAGVVVMEQDTEKTYNLGNLTLNISGTLNQDPDLEHIIYNSNNARAHDIVVSGGGIWNLGVAIVINGFTKYSSGDALISQRVTPTFGGATYQNLAGSAVIYIAGGGTWNYKGGYIRVKHTIFISATGKLNMYAGRVQMAGTLKRFGLFSTGAVNFYGGTLENVQLLVQNFPTSFSGVEYIENRGIVIESSNNRNLTNIFKGLEFNGSYSDCYVWFNAFLDLRNSNKGSGITINGTVSGFSASSVGIVLASQDISISLKNQGNLSIEGAVTYIRDTNNGNRYSGYTTFDYTADNVYINSTGVSGATTPFTILLGEVVKTVSTVVSPFDIRGKTGVAGEDIFDIYTVAYNYQSLLFGNTKLQSTSTVDVKGTMLTDTYVTLSEASAVAKLDSSFLVDKVNSTITVTADSTLDDLYDAIKAYKTRPIQAQLETPTIGSQLVNANGFDVVGYTGWSLVINSGVTLSAGVNLTRAVFGTITNNGMLASGIEIKGAVVQAAPTSLTGVTITGNLTYNTNTPISVTFTDTQVIGTVSNSGTGAVTINLISSSITATGANAFAQYPVVVKTADNLPLSTYIIKNGAVDLGWVSLDTARPLGVVAGDVFTIYAIAYGYAPRIITVTSADLTGFILTLFPESYVDTTLSASARDIIAADFDTEIDVYQRIALTVASDMRMYQPAEVLNAIQYYVSKFGSAIAAAACYSGTVDGFQLMQGGIVIGTAGFYGKVSNSVTSTGDLGFLLPIYVDVLIPVYGADPTYTPVRKNTSGIVLQYAPWTKMTADISSLDKDDIRNGLALESTVSTRASQVSLDSVLSNTNLIPALL